MSSLGHQLQYRIWFGDGSYSPWLDAGSATASHTWQGPGDFAVTAEARCATHTSVVSPHSAALTASIAPGETVSAPTAASGPASGTAGTSYGYSSGGAVSSSGHAVQYFFDWGDGSYSGWLPAGTTSANHTWTASGMYAVKVQARCATDWLILSPLSGNMTVQIGAP